MHLTNTIFLVELESGYALYEIQPQFLNLQEKFAGPAAYKPQPLRDIVLQYGTQLAHELDGAWYKPGGWIQISGFKVPKDVAKV